MLPWYPPPNAPMPPGFAACDGAVVNDPDSPYNGQHTPNLINRFLLGSGAGVAPGDSRGSTDFNLNGFANPALPTGPTTASTSDNVQPEIIIQQGVHTDYRFGCTSDDDSKHDGNHHHAVPAGTMTVPQPGWTAVQYIIKIK